VNRSTLAGSIGMCASSSRHTSCLSAEYLQATADEPTTNSRAKAEYNA
jgi:hypothetical protein